MKDCHAATTATLPGEGVPSTGRWTRRERDIIQTCGCVTYCPKCHDMLNDQAHWLASNADGLGTYKCRLCGQVSEWHFGITPVALLICSAHTKDTANDKLTDSRP